MSVHYSLCPAEPDAHRFHVSVHIESPAAGGQQLSLPNWIPGSYMIRDFSRHLSTIEASSDGRPVTLEKLDKSRWQAPPGLESLQLQYTVYAWDLSVRAAHLDRQHGFFNGTSVFLQVDGQTDETLTVDLLRPSATVDGDWQVATSLPAVEVDSGGFGRYRAADYAELIDHPVEMGAFERVRFQACGVPHELVLTGDYRTDTGRIVADLTRICEHHIRFFGEPAPMPQYVFLVMVVGQGYGGLEHRASTALLISRDHLPVPGADTIDDKYLEFLGLCSHEYFHSWNVKRIKPAVFTPYQLQAESYTRLLWFFEGITSYYDDLALVRCGLIDHSRYLKLLATTLTRVQRGGGRRRQSVTDSSFDAWHKFYKQDENAANAIVSYYAKGALVALCLDARLRSETEGRASLDTLMRQLWRRWVATGDGLAEREPEALASELAGTDLAPFFATALYSTDELPLGEALGQLGVQLQWRHRRSNSDTGGSGELDEQQTDGPHAPDPQTPDRQAPSRPLLGAVVASDHGAAMVRQVSNGGAAEAAGLAAGDRLLAVDRIMVTADSVHTELERHVQTESVPVHYVRHGVLRSGHLPLVMPAPAGADDTVDGASSQQPLVAEADTAQLLLDDRQRVARWLGAEA